MSKIVIVVSLFVGLFGFAFGETQICRDDNNIMKAICKNGEECCGDDNDKCCTTGLSMWVIAAIVIGSVVALSIVVIVIIAVLQKMKKTNKVNNPIGGQVTSDSNYNDPPPMYSMENGSFNQTAIAQPPAYASWSEQKTPL